MLDAWSDIHGMESERIFYIEQFKRNPFARIFYISLLSSSYRGL